MRAIIGARWFPYVLIGLGIFVTSVFGYGYLKGYNKAETVYLEQMNEALARQMKQLLAQKEREIKLALRSAQRKNDVAKEIANVPQPAVSCDLPPACLRWFDDVLRASAPDRPRPD